jgi:nucleoside-diphosphate-sugar epimerase
LNTVLIAGATGVIGQAALYHFSALPDWDTIAISRRDPEPVDNGSYSHYPLDLGNRADCDRACARFDRVTHVIYAAVSEKPGLLEGWQDRAQMSLNLAMLQNLLEPLCSSAHKLQHISLLQGAKAYGPHVGHTPPLPARESAPRDPHDNFYWLQEDYIREKSREAGFNWTIFRPQVLIGSAHGVAMNPLLPLGAYAAIRREEGKPFSYPGGEPQIMELMDATLLAEAFHWATATEKASGEIFNITNGDVFSWSDAWPALAAAFDVQPGSAEPLCLAQYLEQRTDSWDRIVALEGLRPLGLADFLGQSHYYADILLRAGARTIERPTLLSTIKLRQAGFSGCRDSLDSVRYWIHQLRRARLIP